MSERRREAQWTESIAVGACAFVERVQDELGERGRYRKIDTIDETHILREPAGAYSLNSGIGNGPISPVSAAI